jgi:NAD(P)-dependent dehydrogenase (short-subunit alcohol dehydrogenase family)
MNLGLSGKRAIVTGGTRGIGLRIAETLAGEGCAVAICARNATAVEETVAALERRGVRATGAAVDVADTAGLRDWIARAATELGGLDILVPNVSALGTAPGEESWRAGMEIDILGTVRAVEAALPHLERSDAGSIVAISSVAAVTVFGGVRPYNAVKAALIAYMAALSAELAPKGIRANTVSPGTIYFEGGVWHKREREVPQVFQMALERNPMGRMGTPEEVANAAVFLASPAARFITGTNLIVDGGLSRRVQF